MFFASQLLFFFFNSILYATFLYFAGESDFGALGTFVALSKLYVSVSRGRREKRWKVLEAGLQYGILYIVFVEATHRTVQNTAPRNTDETQQTWSGRRFSTEQTKSSSVITAAHGAP